jgi:hypothetical protein
MCRAPPLSSLILKVMELLGCAFQLSVLRLQHAAKITAPGGCDRAVAGIGLLALDAARRQQSFARALAYRARSDKRCAAQPESGKRLQIALQVWQSLLDASSSFRNALACSMKFKGTYLTEPRCWHDMRRLAR